MKVLQKGFERFPVNRRPNGKNVPRLLRLHGNFSIHIWEALKKKSKAPCYVCHCMLTSSSKTKYNSYWHSVTCVIHVDKDVYDLVSTWFLGCPASLDNYIQYVVQQYLFTPLLGHCGWYLEPSRNVKIETTEADASSVSVSLWFVLKQVHSSTVCVLLEFLFV